MGLQVTVENLDEVDSKYHDLYTERDGKYVLTGVDGLKTQADIDRLQGALTKERNDHKKVRDSLSVLGDRKLDEVLALADRVPELEAAASGKLDDEKINGIVEARIKTRVAPVERERDNLRKENGELQTRVADFETQSRTRKVHDAVREAVGKSQGFTQSAVEDALMYAERTFEVTEDGAVVTRDAVGVTPGIDPSVWLTEMMNKKPHWWGPTQGGGATGNRQGGGGGGQNPFTREHWNMTEQGRLLKENRARAEQLARSAGTTVGGGMPPEKK